MEEVGAIDGVGIIHRIDETVVMMDSLDNVDKVGIGWK